MKKLLTIFCAFVLCIGLVGCSSKEPFEIKKITATKLQKKLDHKDSFVLIIERENCPYCESLQEYIKQTKDEHPNLVLYKIDSTNYGFSKISQDSKQLQRPHMQVLVIVKMIIQSVYGMLILPLILIWQIHKSSGSF